MFREIAEFYDEMPDDQDDEWFVQLPLEVNELASVYNSLALKDGSQGHVLDPRDPFASAYLDDLVVLLYQLSDHYLSGPGKTSEVTDSDRNTLIDIFDTMADYYSFGDGKSYPDSYELFMMYDELAEIYGKENDF